ncbi:MAG: MarR family transcriptional regulator [Hyphomicrobiales bacterium]|nr:MarR family transcriptional regulator [Hyphomicrobiales bacterium]MCC2108517.1 MarR family transcriptional regulator [Hyphomicrobiales bacterium]MCC2110579.1 MarR family transcriptional regulator [Hyphomicrobiales bacterium]
MANREDFHNMPGHLIRRAHQISVAIFMEECAEHNVTPVQYACLSEIARQPGVDATRLASAVAFDRSTLGNVLERLEAKGWVDRRPALEDRRVKLLHITQAGEDLLQAIEPAVVATQKRLLKPLSAADRKLFMRLISELVQRNNEVSRAPMGRAEGE